MGTVSPRRIHYAFEGQVATLLLRAVRIEADALTDIASADADWKRWGDAYNAARGLDSNGCRHALAEIDGCRFRRNSAADRLRLAGDVLDEAVRVEQAGRREWGLE